MSACSHARSVDLLKNIYVVLTPAIYNHTKPHLKPWVSCTGWRPPERVDKGLYKDVETEKERNARRRSRSRLGTGGEGRQEKGRKDGESVEDILRRQRRAGRPRRPSPGGSSTG